jgi:hypothetical protein
MTQANWHNSTQTAGAIWAAVGPLVGILIGAYLAKQWQRSQWLADKKRSEYRKLLTTLTRTYTTIVKLRAPLVGLGPMEQRALSNLEPNSLIVVRDQMFIAKEVKEMDLLNRWTGALRNYDNTANAKAFKEAFDLITGDLQRHATEIFKEKKWFR